MELIHRSLSWTLQESKTKGKGRQPYTSIADELCGCSHEKTYHINKESCSQCECKEFDP